MASFKDKVPQFNPYVAQQPVEAMATVGMKKQQQYDHNLQKIQQTVSQIAGLSVAKDVDKEYLQKQIGTLNNKLKGFAGGDFSSNNLTSSVRGMVGGIANDEIIQSAVSSTQKYQDQVKIMKKAQKDGTLTPDNEFHFQKQASQWFSDPTEGADFSGQYVPHFDVLEYTREVFDDVKPDGMTYDEIFSGVDENGVPTMSAAMKRMKKEGIMPEKAMTVVNQVFNDPRVKQQLKISGEYNYQGYDSMALQQKLVNNEAKAITALNAEKEALLVRKSMGDDVQAQLDAIDDQKTLVSTSTTNLSEIAQENPDAVRGYLYTEESRMRYTDMFSNVTTSETFEKNEIWWGDFAVLKEANVNARHNEEMGLKRDEFDWKKITDTWAAEDRRAALTIEAGANQAPTTPGEPTQHSSAFDLVAFQDNQFEQKTKTYLSKTNELIWEGLLMEDNYDDYQLMLNDGASPDEAIAAIVATKAMEEGYTTEVQNADGSISVVPNIAAYQNEKANKIKNIIEKEPDKKQLTKLYSEYYTAERDYVEEKAVIDEQYAKYDAEMKKAGIVSQEEARVEFDGQEFVLSPDNLLDFAIVRDSGNKITFTAEGIEKKRAAKRAESRLKAKFPAELVRNIINVPRSGVSGLGVSTQLPSGLRPGTTGLAGGTVVSGIAALFGPDNSYIDKINLLGDQLEDVDFTDAVASRYEDIKKRYGIDPNMTFKLFGEETKVNKGQARKVKEIAASFRGTSGDYLNLSETFDEFVKNLDASENPEELNLNLFTTTNELGEKAGYIDLDGKTGMYINWKQVLKLRPDLKNSFMSAPVNNLTSYMNEHGGSTSKGNPREASTYRNGGGYFKAFSFPGMVGNSEVSVQANLVNNSSGGVDPYIYYLILDPENPKNVKEGVVKLDPFPDVNTALKVFNDPTAINPKKIRAMAQKLEPKTIENNQE